MIVLGQVYITNQDYFFHPHLNPDLTCSWSLTEEGSLYPAGQFVLPVARGKLRSTSILVVLLAHEAPNLFTWIPEDYLNAV